MKLSALLPLGAAVCALASQRSAEIPLTRVKANHTHSKDTGIIHEFLSPSLYWFGQFDVGASKNLTMLIDTGSGPLAVDPGKYKPSSHMKNLHANFSFTYEGVGSTGFGFETVNSSLVSDVVTGAGGLTVPDQGIFVIYSYKYLGVKAQPYAIQYDGIVGFSADGNRSTQSWFYNLCRTKSIAQCRFGLAYGTDGKGMAIIGKLSTQLFKGPLVTVPNIQRGFYQNYGDVYLNGKLYATDQFFIMDEGTNNIQAPLSTTKAVFNKLGFSSHTQSVPDPFASYGPEYPKNAEFLTGYFPCDKPPVLGFAFPPKSKLKKGQHSTVFNVSTSLWDVQNNGNNNCTSILGGTNFLGVNKTAHYEPWLLGQPFFAGRYIDFNVAANRIGYADLKNPANPTGY